MKPRAEPAVHLSEPRDMGLERERLEHKDQNVRLMNKGPRTGKWDLVTGNSGGYAPRYAFLMRGSSDKDLDSPDRAILPVANETACRTRGSFK